MAWNKHFSYLWFQNMVSGTKHVAHMFTWCENGNHLSVFSCLYPFVIGGGGGGGGGPNIECKIVYE